jgi:hypothetical protein
MSGEDGFREAALKGVDVVAGNTFRSHPGGEPFAQQVGVNF